MKILLIDNGTTLLRKLEQAIPCEVEVRTWNHLKGIPWKEIGGVILSGGSLFEIVGNENRLRDEMKIIHDEKKLLIGICFGCELIAEVFGARLEKDREDHKGVTDIQVTKPNDIFGDQERFPSASIIGGSLKILLSISKCLRRHVMELRFFVTKPGRFTGCSSTQSNLERRRTAKEFC